jgi:hypothetical protein
MNHSLTEARRALRVPVFLLLLLLLLLVLVLSEAVLVLVLECGFVDRLFANPVSHGATGIKEERKRKRRTT